MADFSRTRFEDFRDRCEAAVEKTFVSLGLTAEALDAIEGRLTGRLTIESGDSRLEIPVDVRADLFDVDGDEGPASGAGPAPWETDTEVTYSGVVDASVVDEHRVEALRQAVVAREHGESPGMTAERARVFIAFLDDEGADRG